MVGRARLPTHTVHLLSGSSAARTAVSDGRVIAKLSSWFEPCPRKNGDALFYNSAANSFAVLARDGQTIRTSFKPVNGLQYWLDQTGGIYGDPITRFKLVLGQDDQERLRILLIERSSAVNFPLTIDKLINQWAYFVHEVEGGYEHSIYEYTNDLGGRDLLATIGDTLTDTGKDQLLEVLRPLDARFIAATSTLLGSIQDQSVPKSHWWWYRVPHKLLDTLRSDLSTDMGSAC